MMEWIEKEKKRLEKLKDSLPIDEFLTKVDQSLELAQIEFKDQFQGYDLPSEQPLTKAQKEARERFFLYKSVLDSLADAEKIYRDTPISVNDWQENFPVTWSHISDRLQAKKVLFLKKFANELHSKEYKEKVYKGALKSAKRAIKKKLYKYGENPSEYYDDIVGRSCYRKVNVNEQAEDFLVNWLYFNWLDKELLNEGKGVKQPERTFMIWEGSDEGLFQLHGYLIENKIIAKIEFKVFKLHFEGKPQTKRIDWTKDQYGIFHFIDALRTVINQKLWKGKNDVEAGPISLHFSFYGVIKHKETLKKTKTAYGTERKKVQNNFGDLLKFCEKLE